MPTQATPKSLYLLPDNGQCVCESHLPQWGIRNGRDSRGDKIHKMTAADRAYMVKMVGHEIECESCRGLA